MQKKTAVHGLSAFLKADGMLFGMASGRKHVFLVTKGIVSLQKVSLCVILNGCHFSVFGIVHPTYCQE